MIDPETIEELKDPKYMAAVQEAREDIRLGRTYTLEELDKEFGFIEEELLAAKHEETWHHFTVLVDDTLIDAGH